MAIEDKNIDLLLSYFSSVVEIPIKLEETKYYRPLDRLIIPKKQYNLEFYFTIAHELGHKQNNRLLLAIYNILPIKGIQILLEKDANKKALKYIEPHFIQEYINFSDKNLRTYINLY